MSNRKTVLSILGILLALILLVIVIEYLIPWIAKILIEWTAKLIVIIAVIAAGCLVIDK